MKGLVAFFMEYPLLGRIVRLLGIFLTLGVILTTASDIWADYRQNIHQIQQNIEGLEQSQLAVLTRNIWTFNEDAVQLQLDSIAHSSSVTFLEVYDASGVLFSAGRRPADSDLIEQEFPLVFNDGGDRMPLGTLRVSAVKNGAWQEAVTGLPAHLAVNAMFIILACGLVVLLFYSFFNRHLNVIARFAAGLDFENLERRLNLPRRAGSRPDELDRIVTALNEMLSRLENDKIQQQQAAAELRASREKYQTIYDATTDALFIHDAADGRVVDVNEAMLRMYNCSREEALGLFPQHFTLVEGPYNAEAAAVKIQKAINEGPQIFEWQAKKKTGEVFWVEVALRYAKFGGRAYVVASARDINARKEAEIGLAAEKERLAVTLRSIGDGVITTDTDGRVVLMNRVAEKLTGWQWREAGGVALPEVFNIVNEQSGERVENPVDKVLACGGIVDLANHTVLIAKDGARRSIADSGAPIRDEHSTIIGVVLVFRDVTGEARLAEDLQRIKKLESVGVLAGGIAHDFNNILTAIVGNINLAQFDLATDSQAHALLAEAEKAVVRARGLTQQLLTFARGGEPVKKIAAIDEVIRESADFVLHGSNVNPEYDFATDLWPVIIDSGQVSQVIQNIVINAGDSMPDGGNIKITCRNCADCPATKKLILKPGDYVWINIQDSGTGISPEVIDKIFDPYFTTKSSGSGLGLAVSNSIIDKHDGRIAVQSEPGGGTSFDIFIPAVPEAVARTAGTCDMPEGAAPPAGQMIMVMDDEEMICNLAEAMIGRLGHRVVKAHSGEEAVAEYGRLLAAGSPPDLVIMDLTIPGGMGGREAAQKILAIDPQARLIVSSGYSTDPVMASPRDYGFIDTVVKPYQFSDLQEAVNCGLLRQV